MDEAHRWIRRSPFAVRNFAGFSLVEIMVVISLLSLIVIALMAVFSSTQRAFRASVTQADVLEGGRSAVDLMAQDLRSVVAVGGVSNGPVNFFAADNAYFGWPSLAYAPLPQSLPGSIVARTNTAELFSGFGRENTKWIGIGYAVNTTNSSEFYPLYRYYAETNISQSPLVLANDFWSIVNNGGWDKLSHLMNGVVKLSVKAYDRHGYQMTNTYQFQNGNWITNYNIQFYDTPAGNMGFTFYSNAIPATVELELGILEDRAIARAESLGLSGHPPSPLDPLVARQWGYLTNQSGSVHVFRQRVTIPNVDSSAYQP